MISYVKILIFFKGQDKPLFLLLTRAPHVSSAGMDDLPGGKIEKDEMPAHTIERELKEETRLSIKYVHSLNVHTWEDSEEKKYTEFLFCAQADRKKIRINRHEHSSFRWISLEEIEQSSLHSKTKEVIRLKQDRIREIIAYAADPLFL